MIVGAGIAGSTVALSLLKKGHRVTMIAPQHANDGSNSLTSNKQPGRSTLGAHYKDLPTARQMVYDSLKTLLDLKNLGFPFTLHDQQLNLNCFEGFGDRNHPSRNTAYIPTKPEHVTELHDVCLAIQEKINELWEGDLFSDEEKRFLLTIYPHEDQAKNDSLQPIQYIRPLPADTTLIAGTIDASLQASSYQSCEMQINGRYLIQWLWSQITTYETNNQFTYIRGNVYEILNEPNPVPFNGDVLKQKSIHIRYSTDHENSELSCDTVILCAYEKNFRLHATYLQHLQEQLLSESEYTSPSSPEAPISPRQKFKVSSRIKLIATAKLSNHTQQCSLMKVYSDGSMLTPWKTDEVKYTDQAITNLASQTIHHGTETLSSNDHQPVFEPYWSNPIFKYFYDGTKNSDLYNKANQISFASLTARPNKQRLIDDYLTSLTSEEKKQALKISVTDTDIEKLNIGVVTDSIENAAKILMQNNFRRDYGSLFGVINGVQHGLVITTGSPDLEQQLRANNEQTIHQRDQRDLVVVQQLYSISEMENLFCALYTRKAMHANRFVEAAEVITLSKERQKILKRMIDQKVQEHRETFNQTVLSLDTTLIEHYNRSVSGHYANVIHKITNLNNSPLSSLSIEEFNQKKASILQQFQIALNSVQFKVADSLPRRNRAGSFGSNCSDTDGTTTSCVESVTSAQGNISPPETPTQPTKNQQLPENDTVCAALEETTPSEIRILRVETPVEALASHDLSNQASFFGIRLMSGSTKSSLTITHKPESQQRTKKQRRLKPVKQPERSLSHHSQTLFKDRMSTKRPIDYVTPGSFRETKAYKR